MKNIIRNAIVLVLATLTSHGKAQTVNICAGSNTVITAVNSSGLSNPSYSMNPGGLTSLNPTFAVSPASSLVYTLYVTGTNGSSALVTTSQTIMVEVYGVSYSIVSPNGFTLGCASKSVCAVNVINGQTFPISGGPVSYTFLAPGSSTVLSNGTLSSVTSIILNTPGTWSVVVRDNTSLCSSWSTVSILSNTVSPAVPIVSVSHTMLSCANPSAVLQVTPNPGEQYTWKWPAIPGTQYGPTVSINAVTVGPTYTLRTTFTLVATDNNNACTSSNTIIPIYQNSFEPNTAITAGSGPGSCQNTVALVNISATGIPNGTFPTTAPVMAILWEGPSPQPTAAFSSTYLAQTSGIYTMTGMDMNNGCTKTATYNVTVGPAAAFAHTVTGAQVAFNNASTGTGTNTTYLWNFGDGNTSTLENPTHTYISGGAHLVTFSVMTNGIFCNSVIQSVTVSGPPCMANSNFSMVPTGTAQVWNIMPVYPWNISAASWDWGDGSSSNTLYTSHQYSAAGMYNICLSVTVSCVASSSTCTSYSVYRSTQEAMILEVNVTAPELVSGLATAEADEQLSWNIVPNPNEGAFKLNLNNAKSEQLRVVISDLTGRIVHDQFFESNSIMSVHTADLPSGMYLVTLQTDNLKVTKRMIVSH